MSPTLVVHTAVAYRAVVAVAAAVVDSSSMGSATVAVPAVCNHIVDNCSTAVPMVLDFVTDGEDPCLSVENIKN